jgi:hypothetical protein
LFISPVVSVLVGGIDAQQLKPTWWLRHELHDGLRAVRTPAAAELLRRLNTSALSNEMIKTIVEEILAIQANVDLPWESQMGDFIERANTFGAVSIAELEQYAKNAPQFSMKIRPKVARSGLLPIELVEHPARASSKGTIFERSSLHGRIDDLDLHDEFLSRGMSLGTGTRSSGSTIDIRSVVDQLKDGTHSLNSTMTVKAYVGWTSAHTVTKTLSFQNKFELLPRGQSSVTSIVDPSMAELVRKSIRIAAATISQDGRLSVVIYFGQNNPPTPVGLSGEVWAVAGDKEWMLGTFADPRGTANLGRVYDEPVPDFPNNATQVEILLRPNLQPAANTVNMDDAWVGELRFPANPIERAPVTGPNAQPRRADAAPASRPTND